MVATASLLNIGYLKFYIRRNRYRYDVDFWIYQTSFTPSPISRDFVQDRDFSVYELAIISKRQMGPARNSVIENESKLVFEGDLIDRTRQNSEITTIMVSSSAESLHAALPHEKPGLTSAVPTCSTPTLQPLIFELWFTYLHRQVP